MLGKLCNTDGWPWQGASSCGVESDIASSCYVVLEDSCSSWSAAMTGIAGRRLSFSFSTAYRY